jgi:hypothetical protein
MNLYSCTAVYTGMKIYTGTKFSTHEYSATTAVIPISQIVLTY